MFLGNATHFDKCITLIVIVKMFDSEQNVEESRTGMKVKKYYKCQPQKKSLKYIQLWKIPGEILSKKLQ